MDNRSWSVNDLPEINALRFRSKGVGRGLLQYCITEARAKGFDEIEVGVKSSNVKAIALYKQNGIDKEYVLLCKEFSE